jgi:hypothetical protein
VGEGPRKAKQKELLELDDPAGPAYPVKDIDPEPSAAESRVNPVPSPTIVPTFDPGQYAEESEVRERMPTITDEDALEQARLQSMSSILPPARRPMSTPPGPLTQPPPARNPRDSAVEIDAAEEDLDALDPAAQIAILTDRLAPLTRVPSLAREMTALGPLLEDPKTAYVLGFVDGILPLETIIDVTGLPELETLRVLDRMVAQAIVVFRGR